MEKIDEIKKINRMQEIPHSGVMCDLLWSDPDDKKFGFEASPRGAGYVWGTDITDKFNYNNNLKVICRAHQLMMEGYLYVHQNNCLTVFSAPNYCYRCGNMASIVEVDDNLGISTHQYEAAPRENEPQAIRRVPSYFL